MAIILSQSYLALNLITKGWPASRGITEKIPLCWNCAFYLISSNRYYYSKLCPQAFEFTKSFLSSHVNQNEDHAVKYIKKSIVKSCDRLIWDWNENILKFMRRSPFKWWYLLVTQNIPTSRMSIQQIK